MGKSSAPIMSLKGLEKLPMKLKILVAVLILGFCFVGLRILLKYGNGFPLFMASQVIHLSGIIILAIKLIKTKNCSGLSLKSQELTAITTVARAYSFEERQSALENYAFIMVIETALLLATLWIIYMLRFKLKSTYSKELDTMPLYSLVVPSLILAAMIHPSRMDGSLFTGTIIWAFSVYLPAVTVLPQLRVIQNAKLVEPLTAYYVFALGVGRFVLFCSRVISMYKMGGWHLFSGDWTHLWVVMYVLSEFVHTFILADFCYYYIKSVMHQRLLLELSSPSHSLRQNKNG